MTVGVSIGEIFTLLFVIVTIPFVAGLYMGRAQGEARTRRQYDSDRRAGWSWQDESRKTAYAQQGDNLNPGFTVEDARGSSFSGANQKV